MGRAGRGGAGVRMDVRAQVIDPTGAHWRQLLPAAGTGAALDEIRQRHHQGEAVVIRMAGACEGLAVLWCEIRPDGGRELVAALGVGQGARAFIPWLIEFARANNATTIRTHCQRAGLIRLYQGAGFRIVGTDDSNHIILRWADGRQ